MHILSYPKLKAFWHDHHEAKEPLDSWYRLMSGNDFSNFSEIKQTFGSADKVDEFTVFDIHGNAYRLITAIHYNRRKVFIRHVLTHRVYDLGKWKKR